MGAVFRAIPSKARTAEELKLPEAVRNLCKINNGLILVTGKTGSGKSTTLAAMIDDINTREKGHILTIEDPIEFVHLRKNCLISQREIGVHATSFSSALLSALREDPDVILVGELRDLETMSIAVTAAEMGILVMGTLHTNGAAATVDRMVNAFPADKQPHVRTMLSTSLRGVVSQQLIPKADKKGRVAALEILINTPAIANLIRQGKMDQLENGMQTGTAAGMRLMDAAIQSADGSTADQRQRSLQKGDQQSQIRAVSRSRLADAERTGASIRCGQMGSLSLRAAHAAAVNCRDDPQTLRHHRSALRQWPVPHRAHHGVHPGRHLGALPAHAGKRGPFRVRRRRARRADHAQGGRGWNQSAGTGRDASPPSGPNTCRDFTSASITGIRPIHRRTPSSRRISIED